MASYLGIDPGVKGGAALLSGGRIDLLPFPDGWLDDPTPVWDWLLGCPKDTVGVIELITGWQGSTFKQKDGSEGASPQADMYKMGRASGMVEGLVHAAGIKFERKVPRTWQAAHGLKRDGMKYGPWKRHLKEFAQSLFPREKVTGQTADALLIAEFCRMLHEGEV